MARARSAAPAAARASPAPASPAPAPRQQVDTAFSYPSSYAQTEPFTKPHTVTVLVLLVASFAYAVGRDEGGSQATNLTRCVHARAARTP